MENRIPLVSPYPAPEVFPRRGEHPRVLFTAASLPEIRRNLTAPENAPAFARYRALSEESSDGTLPPPSVKTYNIDYTVLSVIEAKAFRYALTGERAYGAAAVQAISNYIDSLIITNDLHDNCRAYGYVMYIAAVVYDWCYDLMTDEDRLRLVRDCETRLAPNFEVGFPPTGQGAVTGHGCEAQLLRDWLALGIAANDEYPDIYALAAGRLFAEHRDAAEFYLASGSHWQGSAYGPYRYHFLLFCEVLFRQMTDGGFRFFSDNLRLPAITYIHYIRPDGQALRIGDDFNEGRRAYGLSMYYFSAFYAAAIFRDPVLKGFSKAGLRDFSVFQIENNALTPVMFLALNDPAFTPDDPKTLPPVCVNGSPLGSIIQRSSWDTNAAMVYMKVGEAYSANHEHKDAGDFQIFYRGILASDSGFYDKYGSPEDWNYNKQTVSSNCLLIYNPTFPDNGKSVYSGGQRSSGNVNNENRSLAEWLTKSTSHQAKTLVSAYRRGERSCAALAGDLTNAYDTETVGEVSRYMLSIMTGDRQHPLVFAVYDRITARDASYKKIFLLHTQQEPTVDGNTATLFNTKKGNGGKLFVQSPLGGVTYSAIGGTGKEFVVNGVNYPLCYKLAPDLVAECGWGRVEISPISENKTDRLLTVLYATAAENGEPMRTASGFESEEVLGTVLLGCAAVFPKESPLLPPSFSFTVTGEGMLTYYLVGIGHGCYTVSVDGRRIGAFESDGLLTFSAPSGEISVEVEKEKEKL